MFPTTVSLDNSMPGISSWRDGTIAKQIIMIVSKSLFICSNSLKGVNILIIYKWADFKLNFMLFKQHTYVFLIINLLNEHNKNL